MLRRLCTVLLVLACAFAPALPAFESVVGSEADCGCGHSCCDTRDCAPPPAPARATTTLNVVQSLEARATVARPASPAARIFSPSIFRDTLVQPGHARIALPAVDAIASAPLYQVHCTFLI